jgi:hypothetical protein
VSEEQKKAPPAKTVQDVYALLRQQDQQYAQIQQQQMTQWQHNVYLQMIGSFTGGPWGSGFQGFYPAPKPLPPLEVTQQTEPLVAYRTWRIVAEPRGRPLLFVKPRYDYFLYSETADVRWTGPILRADGKPTERKMDAFYAQDPVKHPHGIYAYKNGVRAFREAGMTQELYREPRVAGKIELFGTVIEHEYGYRAEACRITGLRLAPKVVEKHPGILEQFEERYQCNVEVWDGNW